MRAFPLPAAESMLPSPPQQGPVADTNVLFDFLVWRFRSETQTAIHPSLLNYLQQKPLEALNWYLSTAKPIRTVFHVIAELHGLTRKKPDWTAPTRESFWRFTAEELSRVQLTEYPVSISEMDIEDLGTLGPTDAAILRLASGLGAGVLTEDSGLRDRCARRNIHAITYERVLELWRQRSV
jgi:rRNA-processing protein FCF1